MLRRYGKSFDFYREVKADFFEENDALLDRSERQNSYYTNQPKRESCKICRSSLPETVDLVSHGVTYTFCGSCGHFNGRHDDSAEFAEQMYMTEAGSDYARSYVDKQYWQRVASIYRPKAEFLVESLPERPVSILDVGCGGGHFVAACDQLNIAIRGIDVSETLISFGQRHLECGDEKLSHVAEEALFDEVAETDADVISAIGVIEHLREPHRFFDAFKKGRASTLFYLVPMFSFAVCVERAFPKVFPRLLSGGHTHLFTDRSIEKMNQILGSESVAEWRFGSDAMDLLRAFTVQLNNVEISKKFLDSFNEDFNRALDGVQRALDHAHFCSELHAIVRKK